MRWSGDARSEARLAMTFDTVTCGMTASNRLPLEDGDYGRCSLCLHINRQVNGEEPVANREHMLAHILDLLRFSDAVSDSKVPIAAGQNCRATDSNAPPTVIDDAVFMSFERLVSGYGGHLRGSDHRLTGVFFIHHESLYCSIGGLSWHRFGSRTAAQYWYCTNKR
jgi:hypothetical protein